METKKFTLDELEKMLSDHLDWHSFERVMGQEKVTVTEQDGTVMRRNKINIAKQLLSTLNSEDQVKANPDHLTAIELKKMITDFETYWNDQLGRGDRDVENANVLHRKIVQVTSQLIETMKP